MRTRASRASSESEREPEVEQPLVHLQLDRLLAGDLERVRARDGVRKRPDDREVELRPLTDFRAHAHRDVLLDDAGGEDVEENLGLRDGLFRVSVARAEGQVRARGPLE